MNHDHNPFTLRCRRCGKHSDLCGSYYCLTCDPKAVLDELDQREPDGRVEAGYEGGIRLAVVSKSRC